MAIRISPVVDPRSDEILKNPSGYFDKARAEVRKEVEREVARERGERR